MVGLGDKDPRHEAFIFGFRARRKQKRGLNRLKVKTVRSGEDG